MQALSCPCWSCHPKASTQRIIQLAQDAASFLLGSERPTDQLAAKMAANRKVQGDFALVYLFFSDPLILQSFFMSFLSIFSCFLS